MGDINLFTGAPVRTRYREQVRRVAPPDLCERGAELAELAEFCTAAEPHQCYMWWTGDAWAGKSALMSWFVLNPPQGIRVVSFFITARFASQDNRVAFIENVLEQLATLLDKPMPAYLTESTRDAHLLGMLSDAAHACQARSERLVLVVDGLDEDRGDTTGSRDYSIASLLPDPPPADMRIVVAGRPNPPIPADVPEHHRLHDGAIVRPLSTSPYGAVVRNDMKAELKRLLRGSQIEQDLLGLLTAARGGLSGSDLAELTDVPTWQVADVLRAVTGRSFRTRQSHWAPGTRPEVYILGHEELQKAAEIYLGDAGLATYQQRLHAWADQYREEGWPEDTPEYLLRGYTELIRQLRDDLRLMIMAADGPRHDRMLAASGGDADALAEIDAALAAAVTRQIPDLTVVARVAYQRDRLKERNTQIPAELAIGWARLGQHRRAEALARSIASTRPHVQALTGVGEIYAEAGLADKANRLLKDACARADASSDPYEQHWALAVVAGGLARVGQTAQAEDIARAITDTRAQAQALASVAAGMARAGNCEGAKALTAAIGDPVVRVLALAGVAEGLAASGWPDQAARVAGEVESLASMDELAEARDLITAAVARALARAREPVRAEALARELGEPGAQAAALADVAAALGASGHGAQAVRLATDAELLLNDAETQFTEPFPSPYWLRTIFTLARARAGAGQLSSAETSVRTLSSRGDQVIGLIGIAGTLAVTGETEQASRILADAETIARSTTTPGHLAGALIAIAWAAIHAGNVELAGQVLGDIEAAIVAMSGAAMEPLPQRDVAVALAAAREVDRSIHIARAIADPAAQNKTLAQVAAALARYGQIAQSWALATSINDPVWQSWGLQAVAGALAAAGELEQAAELASSLPDSNGRSHALTVVAAEAASASQKELAHELVEAIADPKARMQALVHVAAAFVRVGQADHALVLSNTIADPEKRSQALAGISRALAETGHVRQALNLARTISHLWWRATALAHAADGAGSTEPLTQTEILDEIDVCLADAARADQERQVDKNFSFTSLGMQMAACAAAAITFAKAGRTDHAVNIAGKIPRPGTHRRTLTEIAAVLAEAGHTDQALTLALALPSPQRQAETLATVAGASARAGYATTASRVLTSALRLGLWNSSVTELGKISPPALLRLADDVRDDFKHSLPG